MLQLKKRFTRLKGTSSDAVILAVIQVITTVVGLLVSKLLSVRFSLSEYGTYSQTILVVTTASSLTVLGMTNAVNFFFNGNASTGEKQRYLSTIFDLQYILGSTCALVLIIFRHSIAGYFKNEQLIRLLWFAACLPVLQNLLPMMQVLFIAIGKAKFIAIRNLVISILRLASVIVASYITKNIETIIVLLVVLDAAQIALFRVLLNRAGIKLKILDFDKLKVKEILIFCIPMSIYLMTNSLSRDIDKYVLSYFTDTETMAIYSNASKLLPFDLVTASFITVLIPIITRYIRNEEYCIAFQTFKAYLRLGYIVTWMLTFGAVVLSKDLMLFLYDEKYLPGIGVFVIYLFVDMFRFANTSLVLVAKGKTKTLMFMSIMALIANLIIDIPAYNVFGIIGPAATTLIITIILIVILLDRSSRELKNGIHNLFNWREVLLYALEVMIVGAGTYAFRKILGQLKLPSFASFIISYGLYFVILLSINRKRILDCLKEINQFK